MSKQIKIKQAAKIMGKCEQFVRIGLQRGLLPFGTAVQIRGTTRYSYYISPAKFWDYVGQEAKEESYPQINDY